jgi:hypothetical protein
MELLGALAEQHAGYHDDETLYLIELGLAGLRDLALRPVAVEKARPGG